PPRWLRTHSQCSVVLMPTALACAPGDASRCALSWRRSIGIAYSNCVNSSPSQPPERPRSVLRASLAVSAKPLPADTLDLEVTRISIRTAEPLPVGSVVTLNLTLSGGVRLKTLARVVADAPGMELEFLEVWGERATKQLAEYIAQESVPPVPIGSWL